MERTAMLDIIPSLVRAAPHGAAADPIVRGFTIPCQPREALAPIRHAELLKISPRQGVVPQPARSLG